MSATAYTAFVLVVLTAVAYVLTSMADAIAPMGGAL